MPFDVGCDTDPSRRSRLQVETAGSEFVPDMHHIGRDVVLLAGGELLAMIHVPGYEFELQSMRARNIRRRQINDLIRGIADDNVTLGMHLVHHEHVEPLPQAGAFRSGFAWQMMAKRTRASLRTGLVANDWFLTMVVEPRITGLGRTRRQLALWLGHERTDVSSALVRQLSGNMRNLMAYLEPDGARRLGLRRAPEGHLCSEIAEARKLMLTGRWSSVPLTTGTLGAAIYTERVTCGTKLIQIDGIDGPRFAKTLALRDYPAGEIKEDGTISGGTYTGQFSHFTRLREQFPFVIAQTFRCQSRSGSQSRLYLRRVRMENALSTERRGMESLDDAREDVESGETVRGDHNFGLTVFGDTPAHVRRAAAAAEAAMVRAGTLPIAEDGGAFAAFWSGLPGQSEWIEGRSGSISSRNLTAFLTLEGFPRGDKEGHWGPAPIRFRTSGNTAYDWVPHGEADVGHTIFLGSTTSGKTVLMTMLACALEQSVSGGRGTIVFFDKDRGAEPMVRATGGTYLSLRAGEDSGLMPLRGLTDTPANRAFLEQWIAALMTSDGRGPLRDGTGAMLHRSIARQMALAPADRAMGAVRAFLGFGEGFDGARLDPWCEGGALGWMFDGEHDEVDLNASLVGFNMTALLGHPACPMVGAYLIHRIRDLIDGRRLLVICDECRFYLLSSVFAAMVEDFALTLRKLNGMLWLAAQEPGHITNSSVGASIAGQAKTIFAFPSREADPTQFIDKLGFTMPMYRALTEEMPTLPYRSVLMKRETGSAILRVDLIDMADELRVLSGREETSRLIPGILADVGNDADAFAAEFMQRTKGVTS